MSFYLKAKIIHSYTFKALMLRSFVLLHFNYPRVQVIVFIWSTINRKVLMIFGILAEHVFILLQADWK